MALTCGLLVVSPVYQVSPLKALTKKQGWDKRLRTIATEYQGIDGCAWPGETVSSNVAVDSETGLVACSDGEKVERYFAKASDKYIARMIMCKIADSKDDPECHERRKSLLGFDFGVLNDVWPYSVINQEIMVGGYPELTEFRQALNEHKLFDDLETAMKYADRRAKLLAAGASLEDFSDFVRRLKAIAIYSVR